MIVTFVHITNRCSIDRALSCSRTRIVANCKLIFFKDDIHNDIATSLGEMTSNDHERYNIDTFEASFVIRSSELLLMINSADFFTTMFHMYTFPLAFWYTATSELCFP